MNCRRDSHADGINETYIAQSVRHHRRPVTRLFYAAFIHKEHQKEGICISGYKLNFKGGFEPKNYP